MTYCIQLKAIEELKAKLNARSKPFRLDISKEDSIEAAVELVQKSVGPDGLYALYNNAGIGGLTHIDLETMKDFRRMLEVNLFGHVAMTKAFIPLADAEMKFAAHGVTKDKRVVAYCGGGISATIDLFLLHRLGYQNLTLYDGSMGEWAKDQSLPIETG